MIYLFEVMYNSFFAELLCSTTSEKIPDYIIAKVFYLFFGCWVVEDVIHSNHLGKNGAIAERVAQCSQPGCKIAQHGHNLRVSGGDDIEIGIYVQDDGPNSYQVVQVGTPQTY